MQSSNLKKSREFGSVRDVMSSKSSHATLDRSHSNFLRTNLTIYWVINYLFLATEVCFL